MYQQDQVGLQLEQAEGIQEDGVEPQHMDGQQAEGPQEDTVKQHLDQGQEAEGMQEDIVEAHLQKEQQEQQDTEICQLKDKSEAEFDASVSTSKFYGKTLALKEKPLRVKRRCDDSKPSELSNIRLAFKRSRTCRMPAKYRD